MPVRNQDTRKPANTDGDSRREAASTAYGQALPACPRPGKDFDEGVQAGNDPWLALVKGRGESRLEGVTSPAGKGALVPIHAGACHDLVNSSDKPIRPYTVYASPETAPGAVHSTKAGAAGPMCSDTTTHRKYQGESA